ncbi:MAG: C-GCAxxG-C-C family protein [Planctomycetota bacterium]|nr:C-GCAxxG-C-C family protein [Planctomycetota bacterium]
MAASKKEGRPTPRRKAAGKTAKALSPKGKSRSAPKAKRVTPPVETVMDLARRYFFTGFHCTESILKAFNERLKLGLGKESLRMATGLSAGIGKAKCACGCLTGGTMVISCLYGRTESHLDETLVFDLTKELHDRFQQAFKHSCCRLLTREVRWGHPEHTAHCAELVATTAGLVREILLETEQNIELNPAYLGKHKKKGPTLAELLAV